MNIVVAPDSFKGSLSALEATDAIVQGVRAVMPEAEIVSIPLADGGEGTVESLVLATKGRFLTEKVRGPMGDPVEATFGILGDDVTGVVEMAQAAGLPLLAPERRNPLLTTTYGVGELILAAIERGATRVIVGLGGSATNDGGAGMAQALGVRLLAGDGSDIKPGAGVMSLERIDMSGLDERLRRTTIYAASDVTNLLCGPEGASAVYGPQKGASPQIVALLDKALGRLAEVVERDVGLDVRTLAGGGAAGGLGAGLAAFCGAEIRSGASLVLETLRAAEFLEAADLLLTGEGRVDEQIKYGKAVGSVALLAGRYGVPVIAFTGSLWGEPEELARHGVHVVVPITSGPMEEQAAMDNAGSLLQEAVERTMRLLLMGREIGNGGWRAPEEA